MNPTESRRRKLVFVGAGHAHLYPLVRIPGFRNLGVAVTVVAPGAFWYSGMGPGVMAGTYLPQEQTIDVQGLVEDGGGTFIQDEVVRIDANDRRLVLSKGDSVPYDVLSLNVGSEIRMPDVSGAMEFGVPIKPLKNLLTLREKLIARKRNVAQNSVVVIGGGAAGCELTANLCHLHRRGYLGKPPTLVAAAPVLLEHFDPKAGSLMKRFLEAAGATLYLGSKVIRIEDGALAMENGLRLPFDGLIVATGIVPSPLMAVSGLPVASDGSLQVNRFLQCPLHPEVFGAGDCIGFDGNILPRFGVYAVRQAPILCRNLNAYLTGQRMSPFRPRRSYPTILNLGDGTAMLTWNRFIHRSRLAFWLKDWLDRRFIRQSSGRRRHRRVGVSA